MYFNASYQGLEQLASVNENYEMGVSTTENGEEQNLTYTLNCTDTFNDGINIEDYGEDEIEVLNEYDSEQISTLFTAIGQRISEVNASQMEEIGFSEYGNPMLYLFPKIAMVSMAYQKSNAIEENNMDEEETLDNVEMQLFNQMFAQYEGTQRGATVMTLLQAVVSNNISETDDNRKVEVTGDITMSKDATDVPTDSIDTSSTYNVQLEYTEGLVSQIIITQE